jgi:hypothetical protein
MRSETVGNARKAASVSAKPSHQAIEIIHIFPSGPNIRPNIGKRSQPFGRAKISAKISTEK